MATIRFTENGREVPPTCSMPKSLAARCPEGLWRGICPQGLQPVPLPFWRAPHGGCGRALGLLTGDPEVLACDAGGITDKGARKAAITLLATQPDPEVRLALAQNEATPLRAHELLATDADPEIAALAAEKLGNGQA